MMLRTQLNKVSTWIPARTFSALSSQQCISGHSGLSANTNSTEEHLLMSAKSMSEKQRLSNVRGLCVLTNQNGITHGLNFTKTFGVSRPLLEPSTIALDQSCGYKTRRQLRRRCKHCRKVKVKGRWYIECDAKPRHKQMQTMARHLLYRED